MGISDLSIAVTGAEGFIGRSLVVRLAEEGCSALQISRNTPEESAKSALAKADVLFHIAGANRPNDPAEFMRSNRDYAAWVARQVAEGGKSPLIVLASSAKALEDSEYGRSKLAGEAAMLALADAATVSIWRLPNIFGKWARPNYNSAVATFCHNIARGLPIHIDDPDAPLQLLHVEDLINQWFELIAAPPAASGHEEPRMIHQTTVGNVAEMLTRFAEGRLSGRVGNVGHGFAYALYGTYLSHLPPTAFACPIEAHVDHRGSFVEFVRTPSAGQVSFLTAHPGVTRGGHYHHVKVERFLVVSGIARFRFRNVVTGEGHELTASADQPLVVETIPGWTHDITNIGDGLMAALVWASENFDPERPDTVAMPL